MEAVKPIKGMPECWKCKGPATNHAETAEERGGGGKRFHVCDKHKDETARNWCYVWQDETAIALLEATKELEKLRGESR